jgi:hypothetical protein
LARILVQEALSEHLFDQSLELFAHAALPSLTWLCCGEHTPTVSRQPRQKKASRTNYHSVTSSVSSLPFVLSPSTASRSS